MARKTEPEAEQNQTAPATPFSHPLRVAALAARKPTRFQLDPDAETRAAIAADLGLLDLPKLRFKGELVPSGSRDFLLNGWLAAEVIQPCSITLAPVPATIAEEVKRRFVANWVEPEGEEVEMPEDDSAEPLPEVIDLGIVATEALALALPLYPRAAGVELGEASFAPPGAEPIAPETLNPFASLASLASLKDKLKGDQSED